MAKRGRPKGCKMNAIKTIKHINEKNIARVQKLNQNIEQRNKDRNARGVFKKQNKSRRLYNSKYAKTKYINWAKKVKERDNYTCQCCGAKKERKYIHAHHLNSWLENKKIRYDIKNGITLCSYCHMKFHEIYNFQNNIKEQYYDFAIRIKIWNYNIETSLV